MSKPTLPRLIVVTLHKAGTHLLLRLVEELGYHRRYFEDELIEAAQSDSGEEFVQKMAPDAAYFLHECPVERFPHALLNHWRETRDPKFVYMYRDPRAVLLSQVNYLRRAHRGQTFSNTPYHLVFSDVLQAQPSESDALSVAIDCMGDYLTKNFLDSVWMLHHPQVIRVRYESVVGAEGGGSAEEQSQTLANVLARLGVANDPASIAPKLYDPAQRTFHRGRIDSWREVYSEQQLRVFEQRYGHLLDTYGYARVSQSGTKPTMMTPGTDDATKP